MTIRHATDYEQFEKELLKKENIRKEYEALKPKYDLIRSIIERRIQLHMSQKELAEIVGTRQPAISRLEKGDYNMTLGTFLKIMQALDMDVSLKYKSKENIRIRS